MVGKEASHVRIETGMRNNEGQRTGMDIGSVLYASSIGTFLVTLFSVLLRISANEYQSPILKV